MSADKRKNSEMDRKWRENEKDEKSNKDKNMLRK